MLKKLKNRNRGFTIIEVLIVLAIAGLILLIVFLAVPALQRNGRNTTKRSDASKALGAVGEFVSNNNGKVPATADLGNLTASANLSNGTSLSGIIPTSKAAVIQANISQIEIVTGVTCTGVHVTANPPTAADFQGEVQDANTRSYVALFSVEATGGNKTTQCVGS